jgi:hypothetical protein
MRYALAKRFVTYYGKVCGCFGTCTADRSSASRKRAWRSYSERSRITVAGSGGNRNTPAPRSLATGLNKTNDRVVVQVLLVHNNDLMFKTGDSIARAMNR